MTIEKLTDEQWERIRNGHADEDDGIAAVSLIDSLTAKAEAQAAALADKALVLERYAAQAAALDRVRAATRRNGITMRQLRALVREALAAAPEATVPGQSREDLLERITKLERYEVPGLHEKLAAANARVAELEETAQSMREKMARRAEKTELLVKQCHQLKLSAMLVLRKYKDTDEDVRRLLDDDWEDPS